MKKILLFSSILLNIACSINRNTNELTDKVVSFDKKGKISELEKNITNDFLEIELKNILYKPYENYPICIIKEEISKLYSFQIYEYCYTERNQPIKNSTNKEWILDNAKIKEIKDSYNTYEIHNWKTSDFKTNNISVLESAELKKSIKENTYSTLPKRLIVYLSTPLIINEQNAFMSFRIGDSSFGFTTINNFTALLKKSKLGKWEIDSYYYNPNSTW